MPAPIDPAAEAAEFAALVAELAAPEGDTEEETPETDDPEEIADEGEAAEEETDDEEELEEPEAPELTAEESAARELLLAGDVKGFCAKLGVDPKLLKINTRQFAAMRKGLADAQKLAKEGSTKLSKGEQLHAAAEQTYGPIVAGFQAYKEGNPLNLRAAIELMCEDTFENVIATVARAAKGLDPAQVEVIKLRKEMADRDKKAKEEAAKLTEAQQTSADIAKLATQLKSTPLAKIDGAAQEIYALVKGSFDGTGYGLTVKQAYAQVKAKHAKIAAAFSTKPATKPSTRAPLAPVRKDPKLTPAERKAQAAEDEAAEFQRVLKEAKEATRAGERRVRRAR